ncbi:MAG TPA: UDP-N-acetylmuramoyl-L-alanine--D-glutamate ligase, partial [Pseudomonadales bacterium]|nr:UDP-N-acetylmuramoyl-L-alanine--D-glutamate ligase [Pseudomonadales bacterium]
GNIGIPALDLLDSADGEPDFYVLELSSFQLETTYSLKAKVAAILNISPDHMDRYDSLDAYIKAKQRIYDRCDWALYNRDDLNTLPLSDYADLSHATKISFGLNLEKDESTISMNLLNQHGSCLARGAEAIVSVSELKLSGVHNQSNCLAALAVSEALGIDRQSAIKTLKNFHGLPHRCEWVADVDGVRWINDSKGTNVGATLAALKGFCDEYSGKIVLLLGGVGKGADFSVLREMISQHVKALIVYGEDADKILSDLEGLPCPVLRADDFDQLIKMAFAEANKSGLVLFSPACASFDMFKNFEKRGEAFKKQVQALQQERHHGRFNG